MIIIVSKQQYSFGSLDIEKSCIIVLFYALLDPDSENNNVSDLNLTLGERKMLFAS